MKWPHIPLPFDEEPGGGLHFADDLIRQRFIHREGIFRYCLAAFIDGTPVIEDEGPVVFICHAHGNGGLERWVVRVFAPLLREAGIRVIIDWTDNGPGCSLKAFMKLILSVDRVLVIATPLFYQKALPTSGSPVAWEMELIEERMENDRSKNSVIPILLSGEASTSLPPLLRDPVYVDLRDAERYHAKLFDLILQLHGRLKDDLVQRWRYAIEDGGPLGE